MMLQYVSHVTGPGGHIVADTQAASSQGTALTVQTTSAGTGTASLANCFTYWFPGTLFVVVSARRPPF